MERNPIADLYALWGVQDSLLQSYRSIFITTQSLVFGFAALQGTSGDLGSWLTFGALLALATFTWRLWTSVTRARGRFVTFIHLMLTEAENDLSSHPNPFAEFKAYQEMSPDQRAPIEERELFRRYSQSMTRTRMEIYLPRAFAVLWLVLVAGKALVTIR